MLHAWWNLKLGEGENQIKTVSLVYRFPQKTEEGNAVKCGVASYVVEM